MKISKIPVLLRTIPKLGYTNVAYVAWYRLTLMSRLRKLQFPHGKLYQSSEFIRPISKLKNLDKKWKEPLIEQANDLINGTMVYYGYHKIDIGNPPRWFYNPFNQLTFNCVEQHWTQINDFNSGIGDIKNIWEPSRFGWILVLARAYAATNDEIYLKTINDWMKDWTDKNPLNAGPNWKCGQETALRALHTLLAVYILNQYLIPSNALQRFIYEHGCRIEPTIQYAVSQNNNHGITEAACLFVIGNWLRRVDGNNGKYQSDAIGWAKKGRLILEERVTSLIDADGTFAQYSTNYHRFALDVLSNVSFWQQELNLPPLSERFIGKAKAALDWLVSFTEPISGNVPNVGPNDGAMLFPLHSCTYRDYRPSAQVLSVLLNKKRVYEEGPWDEPLVWLGISAKHYQQYQIQDKETSTDISFVKLKGEKSWVMIRMPNDTFRPKECDPLHLDLWYNGMNILRDGGTYSYNSFDGETRYFQSIQAHNTVQFGNKEPMPRLGRFLFGDWLNGEYNYNKGTRSWQGSYRDHNGNFHRRTVQVSKDEWKITDEISHNGSAPILRWRLFPESWKKTGSSVVGNEAVLTFKANDAISISLETGWESQYYMQKSEVPVVEVTCSSQVTLVETQVKLG